MLGIVLEAAAIGIAVVVLLVHGIALYLAAGMPRLEAGRASGTGPWPRVTVIIAARDEAADLPGCVDTLLAQTYPDLEILVVDGGSRDGTRAIAATRAPRVRVLDEPPLPAGWVGKNWACHVGAAAASGDYFLFTDADVRYDPDAVRSTVAWALEERADLATLAPRIEVGSFWERLIMPFYTQMVLTYFRAPRVNRPGSRTAMANGQYCLVRRDAYAAVGGHAAVRGVVLEDVALARRFRAAGRVLRIAWAPELVTTRMYRDRHEMFEGLLKNVHGLRFSAARQGAILASLIAVFWLPFVLLPIGLATADPVVTLTGAVVALALLAKHVAFTAAVRSPAAYGLLFPVAVGFYVVLVATSLVRGLRHDPVRWKGRSYPLDDPSTATDPIKG